METVEVVIRIPKEQLERLQRIANGTWGLMNLDSTEIAILNGVVLSKGHGDLVDKNILKEKTWKHIDDTESYSAVYLEDVEDAPTVIEADRNGE